MLRFVGFSLLLASESAALALYTNTSILAVPSSASVTTEGPLNAFILQGLGIGASETGKPQVSVQSMNTTLSANPLSSVSTSLEAANVSYYSASSKSPYPLYENAFTATPSVSTAAQAMSSAMQCWSEIATWRNSSASFWNAKVADRTWSITSSWSSLSANWTRTSTVYPSSVSTYSLCDGTPRADVRPKTTTITGTSTLWGSITETLTPTFAAQPCDLQPSDCRILYQDTNIETIDDREILRQCGSPAHRVGDAECLVGGGPVEIIYFPVSRDDTRLCQSNHSTMSAGPLIPGLSEISTLGHTFTSASVYISFKTLFATYDGFWDTVGPTFTDHIVPLQSTEISTQCGGWHAAYGHGTALNYADLNWPVPAGAYECQDRCAVSLASSAYIANNQIMWSMYDAPIAPECSTIWSDINPVIALPTRIKDMVPEWSSCSLYNDYLANFWFDPPIALQPQEAVAKPTLPSSFRPQSSPAVPASTPDSPLPEITQSTSTSTSPIITKVASSVIAESTPSSLVTAASPSLPSLFTLVDISQEIETPPDGVRSTIISPSHGGTPDTGEPGRSGVFTEASSIESVSQAVSLEFKPLSTQASTPDEQAQIQPSLRPEVASAAGFSILTQALSSFKDADTTHRSSSKVLSASMTSGIVIPLAGTKVTAIQTNDHFVLNSETIAFGEVVTVSGSELSLDHGGFVVGESTFSISALPEPTITKTAFVIAPGSFTLSASSVKGNSEAVQVGSATLSVGGPAATVSGQVLTKASSGIVLLPPENESSHGEALPSVIDQKPAITAVLAAGGHTVTAVILTGDHTAISVGSTTLSLGGDAAVVQGATFTVGLGGLGVVSSRSSQLGTESTTTLPSVIITSSSTSTRSQWSSSATTDPTAASAGSRREQSWATILLILGGLMFLPCI